MLPDEAPINAARAERRGMRRLAPPARVATFYATGRPVSNALRKVATKRKRGFEPRDYSFPSSIHTLSTPTSVAET